MSSFKMDIENFEFDPRFSRTEHRWCYLSEIKAARKFYEKKDKQAMSRYKRNRVQSNPETTGQYNSMH